MDHGRCAAPAAAVATLSPLHILEHGLAAVMRDASADISASLRDRLAPQVPILVAARVVAWQHIRMKKLLFLIALTAAPAAQASAATPLREPSKKWVLDYGETACTALRAYGSEDASTVLAFRPSPNGKVVRLMLVRPGRVPTPHHFDLTTSIRPSKVKTTGLRFASSDRKSEVIWINFERAELEGLGQAGEISIEGSGIDERFALPGMAAVLKALDTCNQDLREHWNVSEAAAAKIAKEASSVRPLGSYFSHSDYPTQAVRENASGRTGLIMMIDETGKLKDCMVEETSGIATLDAMACGVLLERAKFNPALDAAGNPIRSVCATAVRWALRH
jgi:hypothetical protein